MNQKEINNKLQEKITELEYQISRLKVSIDILSQTTVSKPHETVCRTSTWAPARRCDLRSMGYEYIGPVGENEELWVKRDEKET